MIRLGEATAATLPAVARFRYDRTAVRTGIVHLGTGAFHRAHQAMVYEQALAAGDLRWGVLGASLRSPTVRDQLMPQDGLYCVLVRDGEREQVQLVGAIQDVLVAPEDPAKLVAAMASPDTHIVTLTVTEKGYKLDPATGVLITDDPDLAVDLASLAAPRTAPGLIVAALQARRAAGLKPFTAMSCDNLPHNGTRLRNAVLALALRHDPDLCAWIEGEGAFPETMVDRIVPATEPSDIAALAAKIGVEDRAMVKTEPFTQWVVQDRFAGERPDLAAFGVQLTTAVAPWEEAKLRLLNGAHSGIAYLGGLAGIDFVHQFVALSAGRAFVDALWDEAAPTLSPPPELDIASYRAELMARFANSALHHRTRQIAMDGSQKLPQRLLGGIQSRLERGQPVGALALAVAAWMRWQEGRDDAGQSFAVDDPLAARTAAAAALPAEQAVRGLLAIDAIFPPALAANDSFAGQLTRLLDGLRQKGARAMIEGNAEWRMIDRE
ncbi:mannitol dehydrogenase family protein [uncultured Sphingomonas sp.]|uniref:mannitol dehydrogenase family protein n=1 Tax=uncultured Sphingomonas sp. TaxID=158754 RepID=UPI0025F162CF|nr:mannitol dehydrogenase family protein [uncultured Sphingomonas sp.]